MEQLRSDTFNDICKTDNGFKWHSVYNYMAEVSG